MLGSVTPRPIALVTTLGSEGPNAAPFSFFNSVGAPPPMVMFSVGDSDRGAKDTIRNIKENPEFVVHIVSDAIKDKMVVCSTDYPYGVDEILEAVSRQARQNGCALRAFLKRPLQWSASSCR